MPGTPNNSMIGSLNGYFQRRDEPNFAWQNVCSEFLEVPGLASFFPMGIQTSGAWTSWTPASQTGWTGIPTGIYKFAVLFGRIVLFAIAMTDGTSNDTSASIALPIQAATIANMNWTGANGYAINNGAVLTVASRWYIPSASTTINFYTNMGTGAWTNANSKRIYCQGFYEI